MDWVENVAAEGRGMMGMMGMVGIMGIIGILCIIGPMGNVVGAAPLKNLHYLCIRNLQYPNCKYEKK